MKTKAKKRIISAVLCAVMLANASGITTFAFHAPKTWNRCRIISRDYDNGEKPDSKKSTVKTYSVSYMNMYCHAIFGTTVRSEGYSKFEFNQRKTKNKISNLNRSISFFANGIGADSVNLSFSQKGAGASSAVYFSKESKQLTINNMAMVEYYVDTDIWHLYNYGEEHKISFKFKDNKKVLKTINYSTRVWYY